MLSSLVLPCAPRTSRQLYGPAWAKNNVALRARTFHSGAIVQFEDRDEGEEVKTDRRQEHAKTHALDKLKLSNIPTAKYIRQEHVVAEQERLEGLVQRIRDAFPHEASLADKFLESLPSSAVIAEIDRSFPEFKQQKLTDLKVFDTLMQFVDPKDRDPKFQLVREFLEKQEKDKAEMQAKERELEDKEASILAPHFPDLYSRAEYQDKNGSSLPLDDPFLGPSFDETTADIIQKIESTDLSSRKIISRAEFFANVNRADPAAMTMRERLWKKYSQIMKLQELGDTMAEKSAEVEPVIDAATNFKHVFRPSALGKYVRFNAREQKTHLPEGWCGKLEHREFLMTKETSLLMRQPTLDLIDKLKEAEAASFSARRAPKPSILYGRPGVGKSAALQLAVYWARKNGWLVVNIKNATKWVHGGGIIQKSKMLPGCWDQPYLGVKFLEHMLDAHTEQLKKIPLRTDISLGKFEGSTLFDLVEYGAALHEYACDVVVLFKKELERVIEYPVLIAIDDYNSMYNYNQRFRDPECTHFLPRKLRNRNLTLTRIFMDSHLDPKLVNGTMIGAVSREPSYRHFEPEEHKNEDWIEVPAFSDYETAKVFEHYERTGYVMTRTSSGTREVVRQLTSGQGHEIWKWCKAL